MVLAGKNTKSLSTKVLIITDKEATEKSVEENISNDGPIHGLINNAGITHPFERLKEVNYGTLERFFNVYLAWVSSFVQTDRKSSDFRYPLGLNFKRYQSLEAFWCIWKYFSWPPDRVGPLALALNRIRAELGDEFYVFHKGTYAFVHADVTPPRESALDDFLTEPGDGVTSLEILPDGAVFAGSADFNGAGRPVGHLGQSSLRSIWHSGGLHQVRGLVRTLCEPCSSCKHHGFCKGGNPQISLQTVGTPSGGDIRCPTVWNHLQRGASAAATA